MFSLRANKRRAHDDDALNLLFEDLDLTVQLSEHSPLNARLNGFSKTLHTRLGGESGRLGGHRRPCPGAGAYCPCH